VKTLQLIQRSLAPVLFLSALSGCNSLKKVWDMDFVDFPESRIENLERLHTPSGKHHYSVRFIGDMEQSLGRDGASVGGIRLGAPTAGSWGDVQQLVNPSHHCLQLLTELLEFSTETSPRLEAIQVGWCARIIAQDPSMLSKERAAIALGHFGKRLGVTQFAALPIDAPRANAKEAGAALTRLLRSWRLLGEGLETELEWQASVENIQSMLFDLEGHRRVLPVVASLLQNVALEDPHYAQIKSLTDEFEALTIRFALGAALEERSLEGSIVRAAAASALAHAGGALGNAYLMPRFGAELEAGPNGDLLFQVAVLSGIAEYGFPDSIADLERSTYKEIREEWYTLLVTMAVSNPDSRVRVKACQALGTVTDGKNSLREEDWEKWHYDHTDQLRAAAGLPPVPSAILDSAPAGALEDGAADESTPEAGGE
jgi:hypothetical protein